MNGKYITNDIIELSSNAGYVHKIGTEVYAKKILLYPSDSVDNYEEVSELPKYTKSEYEEKVKELIKERYSIEDEMCIQRKMFNALTSPMTVLEDDAEKYTEQFTEYNLYVEECKIKAKEILNNG